MINLAVHSSELSSLQILIVEDERVIARDIRACLENLGYSISAIASSAAEAIEKAEETRPDLVLMDIRLKGEMDGIEAAQQIWDRFQIPFIYATGYSDKPTLERARATAPFGYILKPIEERELFVAIETALQRFRLEAELKDREQWLTTILRGIGDGVIVVDAQLRIKFLNAIAEMLLGHQQSEIQNQPLADILQLVHEETQQPVENPAHLAIETGKIAFLPEQTLLVTKNGLIPISDSVAPIRNDKGIITGAVMVFRDITEKRLAEERRAALTRAQQLQEQMLELQRLNRLKDDFLNTVSHELRTPLANIKVAIRMLEVTLDQQNPLTVEAQPSAPNLTRYLEILRDQCDRELNLVNDLLDFQKLNANAYTLELDSIQLSDCIAQLIERFQGRLQSRQIRLQLDLAPDLPTIYSDLVSLNRILTELFSNACKYTPPGETISISIHPSGSDRIQVQVCNMGVEISAEEQSRVFEPFYRIPRSDRWNQGGTGLGLSLVRKLVDVLGGIIKVESHTNQTCFILDLPVQIGISDW